MKLTNEFFILNNFKESIGKRIYWCISLYDINYCFSYADFRDDWGFYIEYTDPITPEFIDEKLMVSCGIKTEEQVKAILDLMFLGEIFGNKLELKFT